MAALTADKITRSKFTSNEMSYPVKTNLKIWAGGMVGIDSAGFAVAAANAAALKVVGVAKKSVDNTGGADGALRVNVEEGLFLFAATAITQAMVGQMMYVVDDQTFDDSLGTNGNKAGRLIEFVSTTLGWILVTPTGVGSVLANAGGTYTSAEQNLINDLKAIVNSWVR